MGYWLRTADVTAALFVCLRARSNSGDAILDAAANQSFDVGRKVLKCVCVSAELFVVSCRLKNSGAFGLERLAIDMVNSLHPLKTHRS